jgi:hypothetical protein
LEDEIHRSEGVCDIAAARFSPASEKQYAEWLMKHGSSLVRHRGHYWSRMVRGFYQPINVMARLKPGEISRPTLTCWGYRASLCEDAAHLANSGVPLNLLSALDTYTLEKLPPKRRTDFRKCEKQVSIVQLTGPRVLQEQAFGVDQSAFQRTGYGDVPEPHHYQAAMSKLFPDHPFQLVIAGLIGEKLGGYLIAYAIDDVAVIDKVSIATEFLSTAIGTGLIFQFVQVCRRSPEIRHIIYGLHSPEDSSLVAFKEGMGFRTVTVPSHVWMVPGMRSLIRRKRPYAYYRLTGVLPEPKH